MHNKGNSNVKAGWNANAPTPCPSCEGGGCLACNYTGYEIEFDTKIEQKIANDELAGAAIWNAADDAGGR